MAHLAREMNLASARLARAACDKFSTPDKPRFVAGALGPTPKTASISPDVNDPGARNVTFEELRAAYYEQVEALVEDSVRRLELDDTTARLVALDQMRGHVGGEPLRQAGERELAVDAKQQQRRKRDGGEQPEELPADAHGTSPRA